MYGNLFFYRLGKKIVENQQGASHACFRGAWKSIERSVFAQAYVSDKENTGVFIDHMAVV